MAGRIKAEDVTYVRDHSALDDVVSDYVQLKNVFVHFMMKNLPPFM